MNMNPVELDDVLSESWQDSALVERQNKVELYDEFKGKETSVLWLKNSGSTEASVLSSIEKNIFQPQLVVFSKGLPVKAEGNINADKLTECSSDSDDYFIEDSQLKTYIKLEPTSSEGKTGKSLFSKFSEDTINDGFTETKFLIEEKVDTKSEDEWRDQFNINKASEDIIKEENFAKTGFLIQEEVVIKSEDEESDESNTKLADVEGEKWHPTSNKTGSLTHHPRLIESPVFKCFNCNYQTHRKPNLSHHVRKHMEKTLRCPHCPYKTWKSFRLKVHQLVHVPKEEVELHKCPECPFTAKWKEVITRHLLVHKNLNEGTWHQCPECPYKTKRKDTLTRSHMLRHRTDLPKHKCTFCSYETFRKPDLRQHLKNIHRSKDVEVINCPEESCLFKTHNKSYLRRHIKTIHISNTIFKCSKCSYQSKHAHVFREHELKHENPDKWFSCPLCLHKTPYKSDLNKHSLIHKSDNKVKWFYCSDCTYKTKHKCYLDQHKLFHSRVHENQFECSQCCYKTAIIQSFLGHILEHKGSD